MALPWILQALAQAELERRQREEETRQANNQAANDAEKERLEALERKREHQEQLDAQKRLEDQIKEQNRLEKLRIEKEKEDERIRLEEIEKEKIAKKIEEEKIKYNKERDFSNINLEEFNRAVAYANSMETQEEMLGEAIYNDCIDKGEYGT